MMKEKNHKNNQSYKDYSQLYMQKIIAKENITLFGDLITIFKAL